MAKYPTFCRVSVVSRSTSRRARRNPSRWKTAPAACTDREVAPDQRDVVQLMTVRSNGQFNTTVYNYDDRFRGIYGSRHVVMMHRNDIDRFGLTEGQAVTLTTAVDDGVERKVTGLQVVE